LRGEASEPGAGRENSGETPPEANTPSFEDSMENARKKASAGSSDTRAVRAERREDEG
jgi:hypothetical protein